MSPEGAGNCGGADLHVHTRASDGVYSPEEVVELARTVGLRAIGICDHDTLDGIEEAQKRGRALGITVVPGIEINTRHEGREVHVLGYYVKPDEGFCRLLSELREGREKRLERIVTRLEELGLPVDPDQVREIAGEAPIGRPHIARAMVDAGYVGSVIEAFDKYLEVGRPAYFPRHRITPFEAVEAVANAGGIPVLAHPGSTGESELVEELVQSGLKGLEVCHPAHAPEQVIYYMELAERLGLMVTGGSDYHGDDAAEGCALGGVRVPYETVVQLRKARWEAGAGLRVRARFWRKTAPPRRTGVVHTRGLTRDSRTGIHYPRAR